MTAHLSDEAAVDLALGAGAPPERAHASSCEACSGRVAQARAAVELARQAEVPEPSPLYWQALRRGVSRRIAEDRQKARRLGFLIPMAAALGLVVVVLNTPAPAPKPQTGPRLPAWSALPLEEDDDGLRVLEGLALAGGGVAEWQPSEGLGAYLASLSDEESQRLAEGLREQARGGES